MCFKEIYFFTLDFKLFMASEHNWKFELDMFQSLVVIRLQSSIEILLQKMNLVQLSKNLLD